MLLVQNENDELLHVELTDGSKEIMMFSDAGKAIRFDENDVRPLIPEPLNITPEKLCSKASSFVTMPISTFLCLKILLSVNSVSRSSTTLGKDSQNTKISSVSPLGKSL